MRASFDLKPYKNTLPYASEIFGIYLPLLGWKSQRTISRIASGFSNDQRRALEALTQNFAGRYRALFTQEGCGIEVQSIDIGELATRRNPLGSSVLLDALRPRLPPIAEYRPEIWDDLLTRDRRRNVLVELVRPAYVGQYQERCRALHSAGRGDAHSRLELGNASASDKCPYVPPLRGRAWPGRTAKWTRYRAKFRAKWTKMQCVMYRKSSLREWRNWQTRWT